MLCTPTLLTQLDLVQAVPGKLAADFVRLYPLTALPCDTSGTNFSRMLYWHRRTDKDPALQWVRGMILRYGTVSTDESAVEALFHKDCPTTK